jgi:hypothetical protein
MVGGEKEIIQIRYQLSLTGENAVAFAIGDTRDMLCAPIQLLP